MGISLCWKLEVKKKKTHLVAAGHAEQVVALGDVGVSLGDVLEGRLVPGDVHVDVVDGPVDALDALPVLGGDGRVEGVVGAGAEDSLGEVLAHDGREVDNVEAGGVEGGARVGGQGRGRSTLVLEDGGRGQGVGGAAASDRNVEPVVAHGLVGLNGHVVPLADADQELVGGEGLDGDKVGLDHREWMASEPDLEDVVDRRVDDAEAVASARLEHRALVAATCRATGRADSLAVEEDVVAGRSSTRRRDQLVLDAVGTLVIPCTSQ